MLAGGILVITRKNPVHSALALIVALLAQASIYLMLYAPFVAGVQIILYAGGIMVLFLFVIMLVSIERSMKERQFNSQWVVGTIAAVRVESDNWTGHRFSDFFTLLKVDGQWKIMNKVFHLHG